ncbi:MAG: hypothetical protein ACYDHY_19465, partial [Acidiferrobacterales bacterium]
IYGDENAEGLKKKVDSHERILILAKLAMQYPIASLFIMVLLLHLLAFGSYKEFEFVKTLFNK